MRPTIYKNLSDRYLLNWDKPKFSLFRRNIHNMDPQGLNFDAINLNIFQILGHIDVYNLQILDW